MKKLILTAVLASSLFGWGYDSLAKTYAQNHLRDAESAKFDDVKMGTNNVLCGYVNAKNGFGAYTGYTRFVTKNQNLFFTEKGMGRVEFSKVWNTFCR